MRTALVLVALAAVAAPATASAAAPGPGLTGAADPAYALQVRWAGRGAGTLTGVEEIAFVNRGTTPLRRVWLRTWANGPDGCRPRRIRLRAVGGGTLGPRSCLAQAIDLPAPLAPGARGAVTVGLRIAGRREADRFGRAGTTALLGDVVPTLAVDDRRGLHVDEPYSGLGESFYGQAGPWRAQVDLPRGAYLAGTGTQRADERHGARHTVTVDTEHARSFGLAIGPYAPRVRVVDGVRIRVFGPSRGRARRILAELAEALPVFERRLGPYGAPELDAVDTPGLGMEYPEFVMTSADAGTVAHELGHQWFFGIVGNDQYADPWLDEAFATYAGNLVVEGRGYCRDFRRPPGRARLDASMAYWDAHPGRYDAGAYLFGACRLHRLQQRAGTAAMTRFLRTLVADFRYGILTDADLARTLRATMPARIDTAAFLRASRVRP